MKSKIVWNETKKNILYVVAPVKQSNERAFVEREYAAEKFICSLPAPGQLSSSITPELLRLPSSDVPQTTASISSENRQNAAAIYLV